MSLRVGEEVFVEFGISVEDGFEGEMALVEGRVEGGVGDDGGGRLLGEERRGEGQG